MDRGVALLDPVPATDSVSVGEAMGKKMTTVQRRIAAGVCRHCGLVAPDEGYTSCGPCRERYNEVNKDRYRKIIKAGNCKFCQEPAEAGHTFCPKCLIIQRTKNQKRKEFLLGNGRCKNCAGELTVGGKSKVLCEPCRVKARKANTLDQRENKELVISAYGGKCVCCGEENPLFLCIDHIHNDGGKHRKELGGGSRVYRWLIENGFPKDRFQLLCFNCNFGRALNKGICPHKGDHRG